MQITKCVELTDDECMAVETTVKLIDKLIDELDPNESYENMFCYLVDLMENEKIPNLIKF